MDEGTAFLIGLIGLALWLLLFLLPTLWLIKYIRRSSAILYFWQPIGKMIKSIAAARKGLDFLGQDAVGRRAFAFAGDAHAA